MLGDSSLGLIPDRLKVVQNSNNILKGIRWTISNDTNAALLTAFHPDDVLNAVKSMGPIKAAGEDDLEVVFLIEYAQRPIMR
ncbi:hypothetical protein V6N11_061124 [Hibiscus sabdariffa]|uniref:Uncharacterized protein n=1 Tax=Hibiscus sabdariffa TaxID=183260 RepID=A0ABR2PJ96_9ROSI